MDTEEAKLVAQFQERVKDTVKPPTFDADDDLFCKRWLVARNWNVDKAEAMLRQSLKYREENRVDTILETYEAPEVLLKYYIGGVSGFNNEGGPIWIDPFARIDNKGILHSVTKEQIKRHKVFTCEQLLQKCQEQTKKLGKPVGQIDVVFDMEGLAWKHLWKPGIDTFKEVVTVFENNYPELLRKTFIVNAPRIFVLAYNMIKHVISPRTASKVHVLGKHWADVLSKYMDGDQLPIHYGGTKSDADGDPMCKSLILYGGDVPKKYYFTTADIDADLTSVTVSRGSVELVEIDISVENCKITYYIQTDRHDIGFGFVYREAGSGKKDHTKLESLVSVERRNTHEQAQSGEITCHKSGTYILVLDNTFSWTKAKSVLYSLEIIQSSDKDSFTSALDLSEDDETIAEVLAS